MSKPNYRATVIFDTDRKVFIARAPDYRINWTAGRTNNHGRTWTP